MTPVQQSESLSETKRRLLEGLRKGGPGRDFEKLAQIAPRPKDQPAPLSSPQELILRREQDPADNSLPNNECITLKAPRRLDADLLQRTFAEIIRRHEIWRTTYSVVDGKFTQVVHEAAPTFPLRVVDLSGMSEIDRETTLQDVYGTGVRQRLDSERGPLLHAVLVNLAADLASNDQRIILFAHLSIIDGVSVYRILPAELTAIYDAFASGRPSPLQEPRIQYGDYTHWQRQTLRSHEIEKQLAYWREQFGGGIPALQWPADRPVQPLRSYRGVVRSFDLLPSVKHALKEFSVREGVTLFTTLAASLSALLYCYTRQERLVLGTPALGARKRTELAGLIGHFLNPVPLLIDLHGDPSFHELQLRVQNAVGGALAHDDVPLDVLAREVGLNATSADNLFRVAISLQPATTETEWQITSMDADSGGTLWGLYLAFIETKDGVTGRVQYSTEIFSEATIAHMLEGLQAVMESVTRGPMQTISALSLQLRSLGLS
jgi:hypothetical protein